MRFLITSGGTQVAIDPVRSITNRSTGKFGAKLAVAALEANADVIYLTSMNSVTPFSHHIDFNKKLDLEAQLSQLHTHYQFCEQHRHQYQEFHYQSYAEYALGLEALIEKTQPDVVILAAAVSDYLVKNYSENKIRSHTNLTIELESAPKLINKIKQWSDKIFLVGFKLLIDAKDDELVSNAMRIMQENKADLIVANNLASLERGVHEIIIVEPDGSSQKYTKDLAQHIITTILKMVAK